ncbi:MAG: DUF99 family protein [Candidatus Bathyarchaeia archaeon]
MQNFLKIIGVDDGKFHAFMREKIQYSVLCAVLMEACKIFDIKLARIKVDGFDATEKLINMLKNISADAIILSGITFAGFNIIDPFLVFKKLNFPIIIISTKKPNNISMFKALKTHFYDWQKRWEIIENLGKIYSTIPKHGEPEIYFEVVGNNSDWAEMILKTSSILSRIPEPVRVAGLIAKGVSNLNY